MNKKYLLNNKGMTLVEVMMAVAVFGIILLLVTQMANASSRLTTDNIEQMQMAAVAHNVAEDIKVNKILITI
ncbi:type II secretion system protein [Peptococcaceae bacterium 1198_IL3148]